MNTCDTCKYWGIPMPQYMGSERLPDRPSDICAHPHMNGMHHEDGCIWDVLQCGPKFGCIHHEPK